MNTIRRLAVWWPPLALFALAVVIRIPHAATIPAPTDETDELLWALRVVRDRAHPLTASDPYIGPLATYATAGAFALLSPSLEAGRAAALVLGALAAPAAWFAGLAIGGRMAGAMAGLLLAVSFGPVVVGSHIAWSHGSAPALFAFGVAALVASLPGRAGRPVSPRTPIGRDRWPAGLRCGLAGFLLALAVAAHPSVAALLPGALGWWLVARRRLRDGRRARDTAWLAAGAALGYLPGIAYLVARGLAPLSAAVADRAYVGPAIAAWPAGIAAWLGDLARNPSGPPVARLADPRSWLYGILLLGGALLATRVRADRPASDRAPVAPARHPPPSADANVLPLAIVLSGCLLMPLFVDADKLTTLTGLRFAAPALAVAAASLGLLVQRLDDRLQRLPASQATLGRAAIAIALGAILVIPVGSLARYYRTTIDSGVTGQPVLQMTRGLVEARTTRDALFIDSSLDIKLGGGGEAGRAVSALLTLADAPYTEARADKMRWFLAHGEGATYDMVLSADTWRELGGAGRLEPILVVPIVPGQISRSGESWGWYRARTDRSSG